MISHQEERSGREQSSLLRIAWAVLAASSVMLVQPVLAAEYSISGDSNTYLRMKKSFDRGDNYPLYEYLRFSASVAEQDGSSTTLHLGAWGRADLVDRSTEDRKAGDLQYGYISYLGADNNLVLNAGRQFVTEGVATERIDGLYYKSEFLKGVTASAFLGSPVVTEPLENLSGGETIYGGRIAQGIPGLYSVGLSALKSEGETDARDREEQGMDLWIHPVKQVDFTGRSNYNSKTSGWMEHAYTISVSPLDQLTVSADLTRINYKDMFYNVTSSAFSLFNGTSGVISPTEEMTATGVRAAYGVAKNVTVGADYKNYNYKEAGTADYFGARLAYSLPDALSAGISAHRMQGVTDRLRYTEFRVYTLKKIGPVDLGADFFNVSYDRGINGVNNSLALTGSAGYRFDERLRAWTDLEYAQTPDFDKEWRALVKVAYAFDMKRSEGGAKSEK